MRSIISSCEIQNSKYKYQNVLPEVVFATEFVMQMLKNVARSYACGRNYNANSKTCRGIRAKEHTSRMPPGWLLLPRPPYWDTVLRGGPWGFLGLPWDSEGIIVMFLLYSGLSCCFCFCCCFYVVGTKYGGAG